MYADPKISYLNILLRPFYYLEWFVCIMHVSSQLAMCSVLFIVFIFIHTHDHQCGAERLLLYSCVLHTYVYIPNEESQQCISQTMDLLARYCPSILVLVPVLALRKFCNSSSTSRGRIQMKISDIETQFWYCELVEEHYYYNSHCYCSYDIFMQTNSLLQYIASYIHIRNYLG